MDLIIDNNFQDINNATAVLFDEKQRKWLKFSKPISIIKTDKVEEVLNYLKEVEKQSLEKKYYAVGFISYEAAPAFDYALKVKEKSSIPLLWFAFYKEYNEIKLPVLEGKSEYFSDWKMSVSKEGYDKAIAEVKNNIYEGNTYQVNYTTRQYSDFKGEPFNLFCELAYTQKGKYSAYIECDDFAICSASPELFFQLDDERIISKPMKGTAKRKYILEEDNCQAEWLHNSVKNRAENVMILDMIRNDIGRIAEAGSVYVAEQFKVEKYPTVWQMVSTAEAITNAGITDIFKALFPCASITGAPKAYTMKIISDLETTPRGIYTGTIGFIMPDKRAQFNVAIRTVTVNKKTKIAEFGVGGGIVWDSTDKDEYEECKIKTKFLSERQEEFKLLESILWEKDRGYFLLDYHLRRISRAAKYFEFNIDIDEIVQKLELLKNNFEEYRYKVRILADEIGGLSCEYNSISINYKPPNSKVKFAEDPINTGNPFVYYKTTNRRIYDKFREKYPENYDVLLWNKKGEITETIVANFVIQKNNKFYTPPISCGLLAGTFREYLISIGKIQEKILTVEDLRSCDKTFIINSIRKWVEIVIE